MKKILLIILDGVSDHYEGLNNRKTPLQESHIPNLNYLASIGVNGLIYPVRKGFIPETHTGMLGLLGYDVDYSMRRGPVEACGFIGNGYDFDLAFRVNLATLANGNKIVDRRVCRDISQEEANILAEDVNSKVKLSCQFRVNSISTYRGVLTVKQNSKITLSDKISNTDPAYITEGSFIPGEVSKYTLQKCKPLDTSKAAINTANLLNKFTEKSHFVLEKHKINELRKQKGKCPANIFLTRGVGYNISKLQSVKEKYGFNFGYITTLPIERGVGKLTGMKIIEARFYEDIAKNYEWLANALIDYSKRLDVLLVHIKGPDQAGHDKDFQKKIKVIEEIDKYFFGRLLRKIKLNDFVIGITSDHSTPCALGIHSDGKVPITIAGNIKGDSVKTFNENSCKKGNLRIKNGAELFPILINFAYD